MGREVVCRVVSRDPLEGVATVAMKQSILDLAFLRREDIPIGKKLKVPRTIYFGLTPGQPSLTKRRRVRRREPYWSWCPREW